MCKAVVCSVDKEGTHIVMLSTDLQFAIWNIYSVLALARVTLEDESVFVGIERVPDLLVFAEERVLFDCFEVALTPSGFLGFILDEVGFLQGVIVLDVLVILLFYLSFFNFLLFLLLDLSFFHLFILFCNLLPSFLKVLALC